MNKVTAFLRREATFYGLGVAYFSKGNGNFQNPAYGNGKIQGQKDKTQKAANRLPLMDLGTTNQWLSRGGDAWEGESWHPPWQVRSGFGQCLWEQVYLSVILVSHFSALHFPSVMFKPSVKLGCYSLDLGCLKPKVRICVKLFWGNRLFLSLVQLHQSSSIDWRNVESSRNAESDQQESEWWSEAEWSSPVWNPAK